MSSRSSEAIRDHDHEGEIVSEDVTRSWGLRTSYNLCAETIRFIAREGQTDRQSVARHLVGQVPVDGSHTKRNNGLAAAAQTIGSMKKIGFIENQHGVAILTPKGRIFSEALGTRAERAMLREALLSTPFFRDFWRSLVSARPNVGRNDVIEYAERYYPNYTLQTRKTVAGTCLNFAQAAGLCQRIEGSRRFLVARRWVHQSSLTDGTPASSSDQGIAISRVPGPEATGPEIDIVEPIRELGRLLAWGLLKENRKASQTDRELMRRAVREAADRAKGTPASELVRLAVDLVDAAVEKDDPTATVWAAQCVNGLIEILSQ